MEKTYLLTNSNCTTCKRFGKSDELNLTQGKPYGSNIFNIPDSFNNNAGALGATKFYGFSLAEFGRFVYKSNGEDYDIQKMGFPDLDSLYVVKKNNKWMLGVS